MEKNSAASGITFMKKQQQWETEVQILLQKSDFSGAKTMIDKIAALQNHKEQSQSMIGSRDASYRDSLLLDDPIYQEAVENNNLEIIQLFKTRQLTKEQYNQFREQQYEKMYRQKQGEKKETQQEKISRIEKIYKVQNILSMLDIIQRRFGEERKDIVAMQIMDLLDTDKKPTDFDLQYIESIEKKVRRYLALMRKLQSERDATWPATCKEETERQEEELQQRKEMAIAADKERIYAEKKSVGGEMNIISDEIICKKKALYTVLEDMRRSTYNHELSVDFSGTPRTPSFMLEFARLKMIPAMKDGLPIDMPAEFVNYVEQYGRGDIQKVLDTGYRLRDEIKDLTIQRVERHIRLLAMMGPQKEDHVYRADGSKVFLGNLIPIPINRQASAGLVGVSLNGDTK